MLPRQDGEPRPAFDEWSRKDPTKVAFSALAWPTVEETEAANAAAWHGTDVQARSGHARYYGLAIFVPRTAA
jgi:hypothetical protein